MKMDMMTIGFLVVFVGIIIISLGALSGKGESKFAVGGFIGFIPFGFWSDEKMKWIALGFTAVAMVFFVLFYLYTK